MRTFINSESITYEGDNQILFCSWLDLLLTDNIAVLN